MRRSIVVLLAMCLDVAAGHAATQTVLGSQLLVSDPKPGVDATKRKISGHGKEKMSDDTIVGDPTAAGATLMVYLTGAATAGQAFPMPAAFWRRTSIGFTYKDGGGTHGPVTTARIARSASGTFRMKVVALGKNGEISLVPPNPGTSGCVRLALGDGDTYDLLFPPAPNATVTRNDATAFSSRNALTEGACTACGNGIREVGEQCDGGPACTEDCTQTIANCCAGAGVCLAAPPFSLAGVLWQYCGGALPGSTPVPGAVCQADGSCAVLPLDPIPVCCQGTGTCFEGAADSTSALWAFHSSCQGALQGITVPTASCSVSGACVPQ
jgi:hypothetical protein